MFIGKHTRVAALVLLIATSGCMGAIPGVGGGGPTAEEITTRSVQAVSETQTHRSSMNATVVVTTGESVTETENYSVTVNGVMNRSARRAVQTIIQRRGTGSTTQQSTTDMYRIDDTRYYNVSGIWVTKTDPEPDQTWAAAQPGFNQTVYDAANLTRLDDTTFDGESVYAVRITLDSSDGSTGMTPLLTDLARNNTDGKISLVAYYHTETYRIRGIRLNTTTQQGDKTVRLTLTGKFGDYGTDTKITLPEAARESTS